MKRKRPPRPPAESDRLFADLLEPFTLPDRLHLRQLHNEWPATPAMVTQAQILTLEVSERLQRCAALEGFSPIIEHLNLSEMPRVLRHVGDVGFTWACHRRPTPAERQQLDSVLKEPMTQISVATTALAQRATDLREVAISHGVTLLTAWQTFGTTIHAPTDVWLALWSPAMATWGQRVILAHPFLIPNSERVHTLTNSLLMRWAQIAKGET